MDGVVTRILDVQSHKPNHHFRKPFLTPYQIAIEIEQRFKKEFAEIGKPVGGKDTAQHDSLAQYVAHELSRRIKDRNITNIEGRFLCRMNLHSLKYKYSDQIIESSLEQTADLSIFRLID
jgi:hypothetical protein